MNIGASAPFLIAMRRKDREITNLEDIKAIVEKGTFLTVALTDENGPYSLPLNYGYEEKDGIFIFYVHSAMEGRKVDAFRKGIPVSISITSFNGYHGSEEGSTWTSFFESFIGFGNAREIIEHREKSRAMNTLMRRAAKREFAFPEGSLAGTAVFAFDISNYSAKRKVD